MSLDVSKISAVSKKVASNTISSAVSKNIGSSTYEAFVSLNHLANEKSYKISDSFHKNQTNVSKVNDVINYVLEKDEFKGKFRIIDYKKIKTYGQELGPIDLEYLEGFKEGTRCMFTPDDIVINGVLFFPKNSIVGNREKIPIGILHELGHASNSKNFILRNIVSHNKILYGISADSSYIAAYTKTNKGKNLTGLQKAENTLHKMAPLVSAGAYSPMLLEEGLASCKAYNWAKELYGKDFANKLIKPYFAYYMTYLTDFLGNVSNTFVAGKTKDILMEISNKILS